MSPYKNINLRDHSPLSTSVSIMREKILNDIPPKEAHTVSWYQEAKWIKNNFDFSTIAIDSNKIPIAFSSCKLMPDQTLKILCHFYIIKKMRYIYRSISHTDFIPHYIEYAKKHKINGLWFSIHCFNRRLKCYKTAVLRSLNGGQLSLKYQPYANLFKYTGEIKYNNVIQSQFVYTL